MRPAPTRVRESTASSTQLNLFAGVPLDSAIPSPPPAVMTEPLFTPLTAYEAIEADYESYGLSVRGHPMEALRKAAAARGQSHLIPPATTGTLRQLAESQPDTASRRSGPIVRVAGLVIVRQRPGTAKGVAFATLEDEAGFLDLIVLKPVFEQFQETFTNEPFLRVAGRLQRDRKAINLIVTEIEALDPEQILGASVAPSRREPQELYDEQRLKDLREIRMKSRDFR